MCVCMFVCLLAWTNHLPKWMQSNISRRQNVHVHPRGRAKGYCHTAALEGHEACIPTYVWLIVSYLNYRQTPHQTTHRQYARQWLRLLRVRAMHKNYAPEIQFMIWVWSLVHACVAIVAIVVSLTDNSHSPCCYSWCVCHDTNQHNVLLRLAPCEHLPSIHSSMLTSNGASPK